MSTTFSSVWALLALAACTSLPREPHNPHVLKRAWGVATAETEAGARALVASVEQARGVLRDLPEFYEHPLRAHLSSGTLYRETTAITVERFGRPLWIQAAANGGEPRTNAIAHELVHYYFSGLLRFFPQLVEEGVAEMLASAVAAEPFDQKLKLTAACTAFLEDYRLIIEGAEAKELVTPLVGNPWSVEDALALSSQEFIDTDSVLRLALYGLGRVIAQRIGYDGLVDLKRRALEEGADHVTTDQLLRAAHLYPPTQSNLRAAFLEAWGEGDQAAPLTLRFSATRE